MTDNRHAAYVATPADIQFAAEFNAQQKPERAETALTAEQMVAEAANPTDTISLSTGASLKIVRGTPAQTLAVGAADPEAYVTSTKLDALSRQADFIVERINELTDPKTGRVRDGYEGHRERLVLQLHSLQRAGAYEQTYGEARRRAAANSPAQGVAQLQAESEWQDRRSADATARAFDEMFGKVNIA